MIVLDTDVLTIIQRAASPDYERLARRIDAEVGRPVFVTIISVEEQMRGWLAYLARFRTFEEQVTGYSKLLELVADFQDRPILGFDERAAIESRRLAREKVRIGSMDLKIAATCLVHRATLISRNLADFRKVPGLSVEDWTS